MQGSQSLSQQLGSPTGILNGLHRPTLLHTPKLGGTRRSILSFQLSECHATVNRSHPAGCAPQRFPLADQSGVSRFGHHNRVNRGKSSKRLFGTANP